MKSFPFGLILAHNERTFEGRSSEPQQAIIMAVRDAAEYVQAMDNGVTLSTRAVASANSGRLKRERPGSSFVEVNVDGAWSRRGTEEGVAGAGIVLRDEWGWFIAVRNAFHQHGHYGVSVKCRGWSLACSRGGLEFAKYLGMRKVVIEGDSQQVVEILKHEMESPALLEVIVEDVRRIDGKTV